MSRARLCELLTSLANCTITERHFEITKPWKENGAVTSVMVRPKNGTRRYGFQKVTYTRFDLSRMKLLTLPWRGEVSTLQLINRPDVGIAYPYRLAVAGGFSKPRSLRILPEDIVDMPFTADSTYTDVIIRAQEDNDLFYGEQTIRVKLT